MSIRQAILRDHFDMIYGWGKFGLAPEKNNLYSSPAYIKSRQEVSLIPELEQAEIENYKDSIELAIKLGEPF